MQARIRHSLVRPAAPASGPDGDIILILRDNR